MQIKNYPIYYLGLLLSKGRLRKEDCWTIIEKIEKRIERWQANLLSQGGRQTYPYEHPNGFYGTLKPLWSAFFFWKGGTAVVGEHYLMRWKSACRSRKEGGLDIKKLENINGALLVQWWWRFLSDSTNQWGFLIKNLYYARRRLLREGVSFMPYSQWWRSILVTGDELLGLLSIWNFLIVRIDIKTFSYKTRSKWWIITAF